MTTPRNPSGVRHLKLRCPVDLADRLDVMATEMVLSRSRLIELLLREALLDAPRPHTDREVAPNMSDTPTVYFGGDVR